MGERNGSGWESPALKPPFLTGFFVGLKPYANPQRHKGGKTWVERSEGLLPGGFFGILPLRQAQGQDDGKNTRKSKGKSKSKCKGKSKSKACGLGEGLLSHPSQTARRMGHPDVCATFVLGEEEQ